MNPLTLVKRIQKINSKEAALGISDEASWHAKYKDSAYVFVGGIPFDLTEGDLLAVFSQYGEIVDVNLVRDKGTGKSKGFAFIAYEDQRSTNLAVDNLNGAQVLGRVLRVDHVSKYKKKEEEDEELEQQKREARGVCRAFQKGECTRGAGCKFSHDEQRASNTGWGAEDKESRWGHNKFPGPTKSEKTNRMPEPLLSVPKGSRPGNEDAKHTREKGMESRYRDEPNTRNEDGKLLEKRRLEQRDNETNHKEERERRNDDTRSRRHDESDRDGSRGYKRSNRDDDYSTQHRRDRDDHQRHKSHM